MSAISSPSSPIEPEMSKPEFVSSPVNDSAKTYFKTYAAQCQCDPNCNVKYLLSFATIFTAMNETELVNWIRFILLALTTRPKYSNELSTNPQKIPRQEVQAFSNCQTVYLIQGHHLCRNSFAAFVQLNPRSINIHWQELGQATTAAPYAPSTSSRRKNIATPQPKVKLSFLDCFGQENGLECPTGREATDERPFKWLTSDTSK